jgi:hypothetical protein
MIRLKKIIISVSLIILPVFIIAQEGEVMDKTSDRFYIKYNHPNIKKGSNFLGTIILQNNNSEGFTLKLNSSYNGKLNKESNGDSDINYHITFEQGSGRIGSGVIVNYNQAEMLTEHIIYQTSNQQTSTDIALKIYLNINEEINEFLMAGQYKDEIEIIYENQNPL